MGANFATPLGLERYGSRAILLSSWRVWSVRRGVLHFAAPGEKYTMQNALATNLPAVQEIQFHDATLSIIDHEGQPFAAMRPIVEGMGLDWSSQRAKIASNKKRWTVVIIATVAQDGKQRQVLCIPIRKLNGWLSTISPNKVRPELRGKIVLYQNECDDALWDYWYKGCATNPRAVDQAAPIEPPLHSSIIPTPLPATRLKDRAVEWVFTQTEPFCAKDMNLGMGISMDYARTMIQQLCIKGLLKKDHDNYYRLTDKAAALDFQKRLADLEASAKAMFEREMERKREIERELEAPVITAKATSMPLEAHKANSMPGRIVRKLRKRRRRGFSGFPNGNSSRSAMHT